jgi:protein TonB
MFDDLVISGKPKPTHKRWTVFASAAFQILLLGILILIPLIYTEALTPQMLTTLLVAPPPPPPPPPPAAPVQKVVRHTVRLIQAGRMMAPTVIPKKVTIIKEEELPPDVNLGVVGGVPGGVAGGSTAGVLGGILGGIPGMPPPPKEPPKRIRIGGMVQQANLVRMVQPVYPAIAKAARIQGTVILHAVIAKNGSIEELQYMSGPPLLVQSAMDAVRQWRYRPTLLNGEPVEVETTIQVIFSLGG